MSYYGYGKRQALEAVDYSAISKSFIDFINEERTTREEKRKEIQENFDQSLITLANTPQGTHAGTTNFTLNFTEQAQAILLDANRRLRSGELSLRDYNTIVNNINRNTEILFSLAERVQEDYAGFDEALKTGEAGAGDLVKRELLEKFSRMDNHRAFINPINGDAMIGELVPIDPNLPYSPTSNPYSNRVSDRKDAMMFIGQLNSAVSGYNGSFDDDEFNKKIDGIQANTFSIYDKEGHLVSKDEISPLGKEAIRAYAEAALTNPFILYDYAVGNGLTEGYTLNGADEGKISFIPDPNNPKDGSITIDTQSKAYKDLEEKAINHLTKQGEARFKTSFKLEETKGAIRSRNLMDAKTWEAVRAGRDKRVKDDQNARLLVENLTTVYTSGDIDKKRDAATDIYNLTGIRLEISPDGTMTMFAGLEDGSSEGGQIYPESLADLIKSFDASEKVTVSLEPFMPEDASTYFFVPAGSENISAVITKAGIQEVEVDFRSAVEDVLLDPARRRAVVLWMEGVLPEEVLEEYNLGRITDEQIIQEVTATKGRKEAFSEAFQVPLTKKKKKVSTSEYPSQPAILDNP